MASHPNTPSGETVLEDLPFCLARTALHFRRFNDRTLRTVRLPSQAPGMASVLHALDEQDNCTVNSLVDRTHLPNGTLTGLLDTLEADRIIERKANLDDGRSWRIGLTAKGRRVAAKLRDRHHHVMGLFAQALSDREAAELKRLLARISNCMRDYAPGAPVPHRGHRRRPRTTRKARRPVAPTPSGA